jgi:hypothetical protein
VRDREDFKLSFLKLFAKIWQKQCDKHNDNKHEEMDFDMSGDEGELVMLAKYEGDSSSSDDETCGDVKMNDIRSQEPSEEFVYSKELDQDIE